jgi:hypothetical protein
MGYLKWLLVLSACLKLMLGLEFVRIALEMYIVSAAHQGVLPLKAKEYFH